MFFSKKVIWTLLIAWIAIFFLAQFVAGLLQGVTEITLVKQAGQLYAEVDGSRLDVPAGKLDAGLLARLSLPTGQSQLGIDAPDSSLYWQPAQDNPFQFLGAIGEWLQTLRPSAQWTSATVGTDGTARYTLKGGRAVARINITTPDGNGYAFAVRAERRGITWWRVQNFQPAEDLADGSYRPRGLTSAGDLVSELLLILWAAAGLGLLIFVSWILDFGRTPDGRAATGRTQPVIHIPHSAFRAISKPYLLPLTLFLGGTILTVAICLIVLKGIPHVQDEVAYIFQGRIFALGRSWVPVPPGPEFFQNAYIQMFDGRWFAKYPPGYSLLLAPALWAGLPWLVNPLSAGVSLALIYACGLRMFGRRVATWAVLLGLVSPWVLFMSASYMSHPTTMMWAALFLYALVRMRDLEGRGRRSPLGARGPLLWPLIAGFAIGMAFITREWTALGIGVGAAVWAVGHMASAGENRLRLLGRYALVVVGFTPPLLFLLYENRQLTGDWLNFAQGLVGSYDTPGFGPGHGDAQGHTPALGVYNALVYLRTLATVFDGWPAPLALAPLALGLFAWVGEKSKRYLGWDALLWLCWAGLVGAYFLWWSSTTIYGPRYWYEGMPFLLLIAGRGLDLLGRVAGAGLSSARAAAQVRWLAPGVLFALFTLYNLAQTLPYQVSLYTDYNDISATAIRNAENANLRNALVFVQLHPARPNRDFGKVFFAEDPLLRGDVVFARDLGAEKNRSLLAAFPGRTAYWLPLDGPPVPGVGP